MAQVKMPRFVKFVVFFALLASSVRVLLAEPKAASPSRSAMAIPTAQGLPPATTAKPSPQNHVVQGSAPSPTNILGGLAMMLGLFFLMIWFIKRGTVKTASALPQEVVEVLGRTPISARQYVHLLHVGNKLLLVSLSSERADTLTEITDPVEVDHLTRISKQHRSKRTPRAFRQVLHNLSPGSSAHTLADSKVSKHVA